MTYAVQFIVTGAEKLGKGGKGSGSAFMAGYKNVRQEFDNQIIDGEDRNFNEDTVFMSFLIAL